MSLPRARVPPQHIISEPLNVFCTVQKVQKIPQVYPEGQILKKMAPVVEYHLTSRVNYNTVNMQEFVFVGMSMQTYWQLSIFLNNYKI